MQTFLSPLFSLSLSLCFLSLSLRPTYTNMHTSHKHTQTPTNTPFPPHTPTGTRHGWRCKPSLPNDEPSRKNVKSLGSPHPLARHQSSNDDLQHTSHPPTFSRRTCAPKIPCSSPHCTLLAITTRRACSYTSFASLEPISCESRRFIPKCVTGCKHFVRCR